jgi:hypothetical protein
MERKISSAGGFPGCLFPPEQRPGSAESKKLSPRDTEKSGHRKKSCGRISHFIGTWDSEIKLAVPALLLVVQNDVADNIGDSKRSFNPDFLRVSVPPWWIGS